jgi:hypothetical protein
MSSFSIYLSSLQQGSTHLVHLFELQGYGVKTSHELVQTLLPQVIISLLLLVTEFSSILEVLSAPHELLFALLVIFQDVKVGLRVLQFLCK